MYARRLPNSIGPVSMSFQTNRLRFSNVHFKIKDAGRRCCPLAISRTEPSELHRNTGAKTLSGQNERKLMKSRNSGLF
jgi:hypothetical protein